MITTDSLATQGSSSRGALATKQASRQPRPRPPWSPRRQAAARDDGRFGAGSREAGFTLLEMLVVVAILGAVLGVVLTRGPARSARQDVRAAASILSGALRVARSQAIATDRPVAFVLDPVSHAWSVGGAIGRVLPGSLAITAPPNGIVFTPEGGSTGGRIALTSGTVRAALGVDWLTGRVSVSDGL